ncbi:MAG: hypothetical protein QM783_03650 [Phycisphaerales bacterium]
MEAFDRLKRLVTEAEIEVLKGEGGNKAAKVRARKKMQEIKNAAQDVRTSLLDAGGEGDEGGEGEAKKG